MVAVCVRVSVGFIKVSYPNITLVGAASSFYVFNYVYILFVDCGPLFAEIPVSTLHLSFLKVLSFF